MSDFTAYMYFFPSKVQCFLMPKPQKMPSPIVQKKLEKELLADNETKLTIADIIFLVLGGKSEHQEEEGVLQCLMLASSSLLWIALLRTHSCLVYTILSHIVI